MTSGPANRFAAPIPPDPGELLWEMPQMDRTEVDRRIREQIAPFNKKGFEITESTTFAGDLEFDSLSPFIWAVRTRWIAWFE